MKKLTETDTHEKEYFIIEKRNEDRPSYIANKPNENNEEVLWTNVKVNAKRFEESDLDLLKFDKSIHVKRYVRKVYTVETYESVVPFDD